MVAGDPRHLQDAGDLARVSIQILCLLSILDLEKFSAPLRGMRGFPIDDRLTKASRIEGIPQAVTDEVEGQNG